MRVPIYICKFQSEDWDLPPYVTETIGVFLDKQQATAFSRDWWTKKRSQFPDDFYGASITIEKQIETSKGIVFKPLLRTENGTTFVKIKEEE